MTVGVWHRLDQAGRGLTPITVTVLLVLVGMIPVQVPFYGPATPAFGLAAVYYWAIHRPDLLRPAFAFAVGVMNDLLSGLPLGLTALTYILVYWVVLTQRRFFLGHSFLLLWWGFALVAFGAAVLAWLVFSILSFSIRPMSTVLFQSVMTTALFPVLAWLFIRIHRVFLQRS